MIGKHTSGGHNELAMPDEVLPLFSHYCEKPTKLMRTPKEFRRWMLLLPPAGGQLDPGPRRAARRRRALHAAVHGAGRGDGDGGRGVPRRLRRRSRRRFREGVPGVSEDAHRARDARADLGQRAGRHDLPRARRPASARCATTCTAAARAERYYDALEWIFSAPDYVRDFKKSEQVAGRSRRPSAPRKAASRAPARSTGSRARAARPARRPPSRRRASRGR